MDDWVAGMLVLVLIVIVCLLVGNVIADVARANTTGEVCEELGFDGQIRVDGEWFCYTACPFDLVVKGECVP